jgi:hypothetical protein
MVMMISVLPMERCVFQFDGPLYHAQGTEHRQQLP